MANRLSNSDVLDYFEDSIKNVILKEISSEKNWEKMCLPPDVRDDANSKLERTGKLNDLLNKPAYTLMDFVTFDSYERIISRKDNWQKYFEKMFLDIRIFKYKMDIILSLRNDVRHRRHLDIVNEIRLRLHCYDILAQVFESSRPANFKHSKLAKKLGLA